MCGIFGITRVDKGHVSRMIERCSHRGPDGSALYTNDIDITLGHNLLSITDNAKYSTQPWKTPLGNILVYNGEIFNYDELCLAYDTKFFPKTKCDTELLAWGLDYFGLDFLEKIDSQHAFAYWDVRDHTLALSRDHAGIKPLYFSTRNKDLEFASELKALKYGDEDIDELSKACLAYTGLNVTRNSFYKGIYKILPGETQVYSGSKLISSRRDIVLGTEQESFDKAEFINEVSMAVNANLRGIRKKGIFLSGGLDSAIIALHASELGMKLNTYTSRIMPEPSGIKDYNSDANHALRFAKELKTIHMEVLHTPKCWKKNFLLALSANEEPSYNPALPMYFQMNQTLSEQGCVITLAGDMGDEITMGYQRYFDFERKFKQKELSEFELVKEWTFRYKSLPLKDLKVNYTRNEVVEYLVSDPFSNLKVESNIACMQRMDQLGSCEDDYFRRNDRFGMHFSMEGRFPWASKRLMNYCMNINPEIKLKAGQKGIVRSAYSDLLPGYILDKQKTGWSAPVQEWFKLKKSWPLRQSLKYCADEGVSGLNLLMFRHFLSKIT